jgi:hypothetical protein
MINLPYLFFLIMAFNASGQNTESLSLKGIIIFPAEDTLNRIVPQDVLLLPYDFNQDLSSAEEIINYFLSGTTESGYLIYIQAIRWTQPEIEKVMHEAKYENIQLLSIDAPYLNPFGPKEIVCNALVGTVFFEKPLYQQIERVSNTKLYKASLKYSSLQKIIDYMECPKEFGFPKYFLLKF